MKERELKQRKEGCKMAKEKKWKYANISREKVYHYETGQFVGFVSNER